jgi:hypothetical protein
MTNDPGAAEIYRLLTAPNPALERAARQFAKALPSGISLHAEPRLRLVVDPSLVRAIEHLRGAYRGLRRRISLIETDRRGAKRHVLEAIDLLNASLTLLVRSTGAASYAAGRDIVHDAQARYARGAVELRHALEELA